MIFCNQNPFTLTSLEYTFLLSLSALDNSILFRMESDTKFGLSTEVDLAFLNDGVISIQNLSDTIFFDALYINIFEISICKILCLINFNLVSASR